jgi:hypothetical protein
MKIERGNIDALDQRQDLAFRNREPKVLGWCAYTFINLSVLGWSADSREAEHWIRVRGLLLDIGPCRMNLRMTPTCDQQQMIMPSFHRADVRT